MSNPATLTIREAAQRIQREGLSAREVCEACLKNIDARDTELHAFLWVNRDAQKEAGSEAGPLSGIPIAVKDNILIKGLPATAGSRILGSYVASYDATVTTKLRASGATFIGKTNLDEFAMGSSTENSAFGPTKNPHDLTCVPGGSSGGSAAAVAANMCLAALGSDTGGSIRQPASLCGVVGLKPTYGEVSRHGLIALASSLDQIGPLTKSVDDARLLFDIIRGHDSYDSTTLPPQEREENIPANPSEISIGVPKEYFEAEGLDPLVKESVMRAISWYEKEGASVQEISLPSSSLGLATYYIIVPAEASSNLARYDGMRYGDVVERKELWEQYMATRGRGLGDEPTRRSMVGTYVLSAGYFYSYYKQAIRAASLIRREFSEAFQKVDVIMTPTTPTVAFKLGEKALDPLSMYAADMFTVPANIAGVPALSIPCGTVNDLPVGLHIIGSWRKEHQILAIGEMFEQAHK